MNKILCILLGGTNSEIWCPFYTSQFRLAIELPVLNSHMSLAATILESRALGARIPSSIHTTGLFRRKSKTFIFSTENNG